MNALAMLCVLIAAGVVLLLIAIPRIWVINEATRHHDKDPEEWS